LRHTVLLQGRTSKDLRRLIRPKRRVAWPKLLAGLPQARGQFLPARAWHGFAAPTVHLLISHENE
jgi:hypothetical protein